MCRRESRSNLHRCGEKFPNPSLGERIDYQRVFAGHEGSFVCETSPEAWLLTGMLDPLRCRLRVRDNDMMVRKMIQKKRILLFTEITHLSPAGSCRLVHIRIPWLAWPIPLLMLPLAPDLHMTKRVQSRNCFQLSVTWDS